jgi:hypothetical protein
VWKFGIAIFEGPVGKFANNRVNHSLKKKKENVGERFINLISVYNMDRQYFVI